MNQNTPALTAQIVSAYVSHNALSRTDLPILIGVVAAAIERMHLEVPLSAPAVLVDLKPAVSIKKSITDDYLICLDDGKKFRSLKRHLRALGMTPEQYRAKWNLPFDYPMTSPTYSAKRSELARHNELGRKPSQKFGKPSIRAVR